jgi:dienelactone hydrolase
MRLRHLSWIFLLSCLTASVAAQSPKPGQVQLGEVLTSVTVQEDATQSYALYLPGNYTPQKRWPIVVAFDPFGRGATAVKLFQAGAEKYGFIVVGSNNSRNFTDSSKAIRLLWTDVIHRFAVDPRRIYTTGLSGGARVASSLAIGCKTCVAGVIACAAGLPQDTKALPETTEWFLATGTTDFNYPEMLKLHENLDGHKLVNRLEVFDGPHSWMPASMAEDALAWLQLRAMVKGIAPVNKDFIEEQFQKRTTAAQTSLDKGNTLQAWRAYQGIVNDFATLHDVAAAEKAVAQLKTSKELQRARKDEKAALDQQERVEAKLGTIVSSLGNGTDDRTALLQLESAVNDQNRSQRSDELSGHEGIERGIWSAFVIAMENGQKAVLTRDYPAAKLMFQAATVIRPEAAWADSSLAEVYAITGDKKHAVSELRKAVDKGLSNPEAFADKDFDRLRDDPAFQELVAQVKAKAQTRQQ